MQEGVAFFVGDDVDDVFVEPFLRRFQNTEDCFASAAVRCRFPSHGYHAFRLWSASSGVKRGPRGEINKMLTGGNLLRRPPDDDRVLCGDILSVTAAILKDELGNDSVGPRRSNTLWYV